MSDSSKTPGDGRQITYRVGWKSGKIQLEDKKPPNGGTLDDFPAADGAPGAPRPNGSARQAPGANTRGRPGASSRGSQPTFHRKTYYAAPRRAAAPLWMRAAETLLRPAPLPSARVWTYMLYGLPPVAFAALCWLAYRLSAAGA